MPVRHQPSFYLSVTGRTFRPANAPTVLVTQTVRAARIAMPDNRLGPMTTEPATSAAITAVLDVCHTVRAMPVTRYLSNVLADTGTRNARAPERNSARAASMREDHGLRVLMLPKSPGHFVASLIASESPWSSDRKVWSGWARRRVRTTKKAATVTIAQVPNEDRSARCFSYDFCCTDYLSLLHLLQGAPPPDSRLGRSPFPAVLILADRGEEPGGGSAGLLALYDRERQLATGRQRAGELA